MSTSTSAQEQAAIYTVTARKWRPTFFHGVVGQEHVTQTLRNAVQSGRIHHAYIFNGPRGVGKTTTARILAKALNCLNPGPDAEPCNECTACMDIATGRSLDVIEIDGASNNSVDDVRKLRENAKYPPVGGKYKMYIIDEVHMLSTSAFNALLKTLEEPPRHLMFVFATTEPHKVPATILSRCQRFDFRRMQIDDIVNHLRYIAGQENITIDEESLVVIAKKGDGSMRDSQSIFDQVVSFCGTTVSYAHVNEALNLIDQEFFFTVSRAIRQHDIPTILELTRQVFMRGYDLQECLNGLAEHFRNILTVVATGDVKLIETSKAFHEAYEKEAVFFTQGDVLQLMHLIITTEQALRFAPQPRLRFEFALIQMAKMDSAVELSALLRELDDLKKKLDSGLISASAPAAPATTPAAPAITPVAPATAAPVRPQEQPQTSPRPAATAEPAPNYSTAPAQQQPERVTPPAVVQPTRQEQPPQQEQKSQPEQNRQEQKPQEQKNRQQRIIPAAELEQHWAMFTRSSEVLDTAFKRLAKAAMFTVTFADGQVILTPGSPIVAGNLTEKKILVADALKAYFQSEVAVHVTGGTGGKQSIFDDVIPENRTAEPAGQYMGGQLPNEPPAAPVQPPVQALVDNSFGVQVPAPAEPEPAKDGATLHPLDKAIIEHFSANEIPVR